MYLFQCDFDEIPTFIKLISDFDCWLFKLDNTLEFKYSLESTDYDALDVIWNSLMRDENTKTKEILHRMIEEGKAISKYVTKEYEQYRKKYAYESCIDGIKCLVVNRSCNSLIFGKLINEYPIVAIWAFDGEIYKYSIYSENPEIDCSKIAERYGGGGHRGTSGFVSKEMILIKLKNKGE
jgi:nanoRNase/pAp phosphatase (c-di-AMP/oligoRNAs hydrolase)